MKYYMKKSNNSVTAAKGKYVAKVRHYQTVDFDTIAQRITDSCTLTKADVVATLTAFGEEMQRALQEGDVVEMPNIGKFKLEMEVAPVDNPEDFDPAKHLKRFQMHVLPATKDRKRKLYQDIKLERE